MIPLRLLDWIEDTPPLKRWGLLVLLVGLIICLFYVGVVLPQEQSVREMMVTAKSLTAEIAQVRSELEEGRTVQMEMARWEQQIPHPQSAETLPEGRGAVLQRISDRAAKNEVKILLWKPLPIQPDLSGFLVQMPILLNLEGTFPNLVGFFDQLRSLRPALTVRELTMQAVSQQEGKSLVNVSCQLVGHTYSKSAPVEHKSLMVMP